MEEPSRLYRLLEERLDGTLVEYVASRRPATSWRDLAEEISSTTGIEVSHEALRVWFADRIEVRAYVRGETPASTGSAA
jgi:hypothetical protein